MIFIIVAGGTGIVEMLFCTSLVALVGAGEHPAFSPRQLQIINTKVKKKIVIFLIIIVVHVFIYKVNTLETNHDL